MDELLVDPLVETGKLRNVSDHNGDGAAEKSTRTVLLKPGVMDPVALSVVDAARDLSLSLDSVRTFRRYYFDPAKAKQDSAVIDKVLANDAIEQVVEGPLSLEHLSLGSSYSFHLALVAAA